MEKNLLKLRFFHSMKNLDKCVVIAGAGGHARVCSEVLIEQGYDIPCCVALGQINEHVNGIPVLNGDDNFIKLRGFGYSKAFVAIGNNTIRADVVRSLIALGYQIVNAISAHSCVSKNVKIGEGVVVMPGAIINNGARIGSYTIINSMSLVEHDCLIGDFVHLGPQSGLGGGVKVFNYVMVGIGAKIKPGVTLHANSKVGAGSVVIRDVESHQTVVGVPASLLER